jgi:predicted metal-dependent phosphoesterase TrpH
MSVTDHDTTAGWAEAAEAASRAGIDFIAGIEITAVLDGADVHVLGYFPSRSVPLLEHFLGEQRADRFRRVREMAARLAALGMPLDLDETLRAIARTPGRTPGRPILADAMVAAGHVSTRDEAFARFLGRGRPAFVPRTGAAPQEVVESIVAAGGLPSLAHPGLLQRDEVILPLILAGLPAIEAYHPEHDAETTGRYRRLASASRLLVTGGSDFHGVEAGHHENSLGRVGLPPEDYDTFRARLLA